MKQLFFGVNCLAALSFSPMAFTEPAEHYVAVQAGLTDWAWEEFKPGVSGELYQALEEDGSIGSLSFSYGVKQAYEYFGITYSQASDTVDYLGDPGPAPGLALRPTTTDYKLENLEFEFGSEFEVDYIKPYGAVLAGYHRRERNINNSEGFLGLRDEIYRYYYWGILLEAELLHWGGLSMDVGAEYTRSLKPKIHAKAFIVSADGTLTPSGESHFDLEPLVSVGGHISLNYVFLRDWQSSLTYKYSEMDKDLTAGEPKVGRITSHPAVEQTLKHVGLSFSYRFK